MDVAGGDRAAGGFVVGLKTQMAWGYNAVNAVYHVKVFKS